MCSIIKRIVLPLLISSIVWLDSDGSTETANTATKKGEFIYYTTIDLNGKSAKLNSIKATVKRKNPCILKSKKYDNLVDSICKSETLGNLRKEGQSVGVEGVSNYIRELIKICLAELRAQAKHPSVAFTYISDPEFSENRLTAKDFRKKLASVLTDPIRFPLPVNEFTDIKMITGKDKAKYSWLALNYAEGISSPPGKETWTAVFGLDADTLVVATRVTDRHIKGRAHMNILSDEHIVFARGFSNFGTDDMELKLKKHLMSKSDTSTVPNPCAATAESDLDGILFEPTNDYDKCLVELEAIISSFIDCEQNPCYGSSTRTVYLPELESTNKISFVGDFYRAYVHYGFSAEQKINHWEFVEALKDKKKRVREDGKQEDHLLVATYMSILVRLHSVEDGDEDDNNSTNTDTDTSAVVRELFAVDAEGLRKDWTMGALTTVLEKKFCKRELFPNGKGIRDVISPIAVAVCLFIFTMMQYRAAGSHWDEATLSC